ncbi:uncharacterized protein LAESUDRAFT_713203 [Laetiporus sulphureus 93-53]|uniref:Uncharacterized protein n=1 Tax=Laetiporus sulphureus 93-53 TaxID=1314785 RepID=A0A165EVT3_9APHY|nr:uncharacterized protein LAESUDRAFT_713203 [Laetiporus sulphureus 93-53]KZT07869.1 hypothetical protein LAESUDRAFT_713203 [Laetiporus sulphureus 93-53]
MKREEANELLKTYGLRPVEVHTTETIAAGSQELLHFSDCLKNYYTKFPTKNWNFPKIHTHKHAFADILAKGVTRNYSTKPNEKKHGPIKTSYLLRSNKKDVANHIRLK